MTADILFVIEPHGSVSRELCDFRANRGIKDIGTLGSQDGREEDLPKMVIHRVWTFGAMEDIPHYQPSLTVTVVRVFPILVLKISEFI